MIFENNNDNKNNKQNIIIHRKHPVNARRQKGCGWYGYKMSDKTVKSTYCHKNYTRNYCTIILVNYCAALLAIGTIRQLSKNKVSRYVY